MDFKKILLAAVLVFALSACSDDSQQEETSTAEDTSSSAGTSSESAMQEETTAETTESMVGAGEVTVGGFVVESPGVPERSVPEVATDPEAVNEYLAEVRPIIDGTVRDITGLVEPDLQVDEDGVSLDLNLTSLDEARQSIEDGANELREIQPPDGLEPLNDRLIQAYEDVLPEYRNVAEAAQNGDPEQFATAVDESLPEIQAFNNEVNQILQDLERASEVN